jgi:ketosteroid isomerase-like protein
MTQTGDQRGDLGLDSPGTAPDGTLRQALIEHLTALQARDIKRFSATIGNEVAVVDSAGSIMSGRESVLRSHEEWFASNDPWTFDYSIVFVSEFRDAGLAVITVTYRQTPEDEPANFLLSLVFVRSDAARWRFVFDQNTALAPPNG